MLGDADNHDNATMMMRMMMSMIRMLTILRGSDVRFSAQRALCDKPRSPAGHLIETAILH